MIRPYLTAIAAASALLTGCANLAPDYQSPAAPVPTQWRSTAQGDATASTGGTAFSSAWRDVVTDARLAQVIDLALANNRDLRVSAGNIEVARSTWRIQRAALSPTLDGTASATRQRTPATSSSTGRATTTNSYSVELGVASWELDLFGRVRNLSDAALQKYFNLIETQRSTRISLVAEVATAWLTLAADRQLLALAQETQASRERTWSLQEQARALGGATALTVAQSRASLESARADAAAYRSQVEQDRNALELLVGASVPDTLLPQADDAALADGGAGASQLVEVPAGLPSTVLAQRPDVQAAERTLRADNASIGAARAAFFPSISLTAAAGTASTSLGRLFSGASGAWSFAPSISLPIFDGGANQASLDSARAQQQADLATYEKTVQTAFSEVADALAVRATLAERLAALTAQVNASQQALTLSQALYREGASSYLDVLDAQRTLYSARQTLISLRLSEQSNRVTLYKVLGGGSPASEGGEALPSSRASQG